MNGAIKVFSEPLQHPYFALEAQTKGALCKSCDSVGSFRRFSGVWGLVEVGFFIKNSALFEAASTSLALTGTQA